MHRTLSSRPVRLAGCGLLAFVAGCNSRKPATETASAGATAAVTGAPEGSAKIALTTASEEAKALYLEGRELFEQLRLHDGRQLFEKAAAKDPNFALAHYSLAISAPTAKDFFAHLKQAVALSDRASEGERLMILTLQAGADANPKKAQEYAEELVAKYPRDERAHQTLGNAYFGQQRYEDAIAQYREAVAINPSFSPAYNSLGYAYRPVGNYDEAEKAFKKYIELIPNDPNPYDSYAELLMKMGRFDQSIAQYRKALSIDPHFGNSHFGIATDYMLQGKHDQAIAEAQKLYDAARNDADRRTALFSQVMTYVDAGQTAQALRRMEKLYALGAGIGDTAAMSGDAVSIGNILLDAGKPNEALKRFVQAVKLVESSSLSADVKEDTRLAHQYNVARVALQKKDLARAHAEAERYLQGATARQNPFRIRQAHELAGSIALQEKEFDRALSEFAQANQQDPFVLYSTALAYQGKGDGSKAKEWAEKAANMNILPTLNYVFVRSEAKKLLGELG